MPRIATTVIPFTEEPVAEGNFDRTRATIDRIVIHTMVGTWQGAAKRFNDPTQQVSAHYGVKLDGTLIHWLEEYYTAFHAGDYPMNQRSIGIEHEDNGDYNGVRPDILYSESAKLVKDICDYYKIPIDRQHILKHNEVSDHPTGCPDALDIDRIVREAGGVNTHADDLTKMLNWDYVVDTGNSENLFSLKLDKLDKNGGKIVVGQIENLKSQLSQVQDALNKVEAERDAFRKERDQALQNAVPHISTNAGANISLLGKDRQPTVPDVQPATSNSRTDIPLSPTPAKTFWTSLINFLKKILK